MANMQIYSKTGEFVSNVDTNNYVISEPGVIIKMTMDKKMIVGTQKSGDDLIILQRAGSKIVFEGFLKANGKDVNKLVIEDTDGLFVSSYDVPFAGLAFIGVASIDDVATSSVPDDVAPAWVFPLIALTVMGGAIATSHSGGSSGSSKPVEPIKPVPNSETPVQKDADNGPEAVKDGPSGSDKPAEPEVEQAPNEQPEDAEALVLATLLDFATTNAGIKTADKVADDLAGIKLVAANGEGEINLDNVVTEETAAVIEQIGTEAVHALGVVNPAVSLEEDIGSLTTLVV